jgi:hypothetical protein
MENSGWKRHLHIRYSCRHAEFAAADLGEHGHTLADLFVSVRNCRRGVLAGPVHFAAGAGNPAACNGVRSNAAEIVSAVSLVLY